MLNEPVPLFVQHMERIINEIERDSKSIIHFSNLAATESRCLDCVGQIIRIVTSKGFTYHTRRLLIKLNILLCILYLQHNTMMESVYSYQTMMNLYESMIKQCDEMLRVRTPGLVHPAFVQEFKNGFESRKNALQRRRQLLNVID